MIHITSTVQTLRDMIKPVFAIDDECRLNISPEGLSVKVVDPANVAMIILDLPSAEKVIYGLIGEVDCLKKQIIELEDTICAFKETTT